MSDLDSNSRFQYYFHSNRDTLAFLQALIEENFSDFLAFLQNQTIVTQNRKQSHYELFAEDGIARKIRKYDKSPPAPLAVCREISTNPLLLALAEAGGFDEKVVDAILYLMNQLDRNLQENRFELLNFLEDNYIEESCQYWNDLEDEEVMIHDPVSSIKRKRRRKVTAFSDCESFSSSSSTATSQSHSGAAFRALTASRSNSSRSSDFESEDSEDEVVEKPPMKVLMNHWNSICQFCFHSMPPESSFAFFKYEENYRPLTQSLGDTDSLFSVYFGKSKAHSSCSTLLRRISPVGASSPSSSTYPTYRAEDDIEDEKAVASFLKRAGFPQSDNLQVFNSWSQFIRPHFSYNNDSVLDEWFSQKVREKRKRSFAELHSSLPSQSNKKARFQNHHLNIFSSSEDFPIPVTSHHPAAWNLGMRPSLEEAKKNAEHVSSGSSKYPFEFIHPAFIRSPLRQTTEILEPADVNDTNERNPSLQHIDSGAHLTGSKIENNPLNLLQLALERLQFHLEAFAARNFARLTSIYSHARAESDLSLQSSATTSKLDKLHQCLYRLYRYNEPKHSNRIIYQKRSISSATINQKPNEEKQFQHNHLHHLHLSSLNLPNPQSFLLPSNRIFFAEGQAVQSNQDQRETIMSRKDSMLSMFNNFESMVGACNDRHFPENYERFLSKLKVGDVLLVRLKGKNSSGYSTKRKGVVLQLKKDLTSLRYVKVKVFSSERSFATHYFRVHWIAVEDGCLEPLVLKEKMKEVSEPVHILEQGKPQYIITMTIGGRRVDDQAIENQRYQLVPSSSIFLAEPSKAISKVNGEPRDSREEVLNVSTHIAKSNSTKQPIIPIIPIFFQQQRQQHQHQQLPPPIPLSQQQQQQQQSLNDYKFHQSSFISPQFHILPGNQTNYNAFYNHSTFSFPTKPHVSYQPVSHPFSPNPQNEQFKSLLTNLTNFRYLPTNGAPHEANNLPISFSDPFPSPLPAPTVTTKDARQLLGQTSSLSYPSSSVTSLPRAVDQPHAYAESNAAPLPKSISLTQNLITSAKMTDGVLSSAMKASQPATKLETFRLLPGGQLRKNNGSSTKFL